MNPNTVTYNSLIDGMCKSRRIDYVWDLVDEMHDRGVISNPYATCCNKMRPCRQKYHDMSGNNVNDPLTITLFSISNETFLNQTGHPNHLLLPNVVSTKNYLSL
ncbi:hypothetical protein Fmac_015813 [Flemingia macrophylla]|uniref:Pentatricopeptide repeat-containing protein n=1 Tax=Flemingia macrophylla TaxID=520843 RepID=A0ABD1MFM1_9FABA